MASFTPLRTLAGHKGEVLSLAMTQKGETLATGSHDGTVRLWQPESGELLHVLTDHAGPVTAVSFTHNDQFLASKSADSTVRLWRCADWQTVAILEETHSSFAFAGLAFQPNGNLLASLGDKDTVIRIWALDFAVWQK